jgi:hypothetical protein
MNFEYQMSMKIIIDIEKTGFYPIAFHEDSNSFQMNDIVRELTKHHITYDILEH